VSADIPSPLDDLTPVELAIAKLELRPGDVLVLKMDAVLSFDVVERLKRSLAAVIPEGVKTMVLDQRCIDLSVVRSAEKPT
jgi:hypothetical protein